MRILIACSWSLPHAGGVNTYVNQLVKGLQRAGHYVDTFSPTPGGNGFYIPNKELFIDKNRLQSLIAEQTNRYMDQHFPGIDPWIKHSEIERYCMEAAAMYFGVAEYDVIHAQDIISAHALSRVKLPHTPLITTIHGCLTKEWFVKLNEMGLTDQDESSPLWHYSSLREYVGATISDVTISPSKWLKRLLVDEFAVPEPQIIVSQYGIDVEEFKQNMKRESINMKPEGKKVFLCPARFDVVKGHIHLIQALAKLKEEREDWVCWMAGDGSLREELNLTTHNFGLDDHVIFLGNREDVPELINQADFIVLPSMQDNQPFAIIEAQIAGKPVIASDAGGIPEMVTHSLNGLVFSAGDQNQLHLCLRTALENSSLMSTMAVYAKEWGENHWALSSMTSRILEFYELAQSKHPIQDFEIKQDIEIEPQPEQKSTIITKKGRKKWRVKRRKKHLKELRLRRHRIKRRKLKRKRS